VNPLNKLHKIWLFFEPVLDVILDGFHIVIGDLLDVFDPFSVLNGQI